MKTIVTGGQTGVDRGALDAALDQGFPCGGWCPEGRTAEDGVIPGRYPLRELPGGGYEERTLQNVLDSDGTLILYFGDLSGGTELTQVDCIRHRKPYKLVDAREISASRAAALGLEFVASRGIGVLNVAGPRLSNWSGAEGYAREVVQGIIEGVRRNAGRADRESSTV